MITVLVGSVAAACAAPVAPTPTTPPAPGSPVVAEFSARPSGPTAPALVAYSWSVVDPDGDALTCRLDGDGDGLVDVVVTNCQVPGSRNVAVTATGLRTAVLSVSDATNTAAATTVVALGAGTSETYDIVLRPQSALPSGAAAAFAEAEARWEAVVTRGVPAVTAELAAGACGGVNGALPPTSVDDLLIDVATTTIDGPGGVLAVAGPCLIGTTDRLPRFGVMQFDADDLGPLLGAGLLDDVVVHEMGHVLGIGTVWDDKLVITGAGGPDPRYTGVHGRAEWSALGRSGTVPVEGDGGPGTADAHWDEATFDNELMTGFIDLGANPLSRLTVASLADLGYQVDLGPADPYDLPTVTARVAALFTDPGGTAVRADSEVVLVDPVGSAPTR